jgi:hypothetical protein
MYGHTSSLAPFVETIPFRRHIIYMYGHTSSLAPFVETLIYCLIQALRLKSYNDVIISHRLRYKRLDRLYSTRITISLPMEGLAAIYRCGNTLSTINYSFLREFLIKPIQNCNN